MPQAELPYGYYHALPVRHIVARMFDFNEDTNELPFEQVLYLWVEQAEDAYKAAQENSTQPHGLTTLQAEIDRRKDVHTEAMKMHVELNTAADDIDQERGHPYLVLSKPYYKTGQVKFTIPSLYIWAKECHGKLISEWAPPEDQAPVSSQEAEYTPRGSALGDLETLSIIAGELGRLIDKLVEDERIEHPTGKRCIDDDDSMDLLAIAEYIAKSPQPRLSAGNSTVSLEDRHLANIADVESLTLGLVAHSFSHLVEHARVSEWVVFRDNCDEEIRTPFHNQGKYNASHIYSYLRKRRALKVNTKNQSKSAIDHRLGPAQALVQKQGLPQFSVEQLHGLLEKGHESHLSRLQGGNP
jgi:hypothetical protein